MGAEPRIRVSARPPLGGPHPALPAREARTRRVLAPAGRRRQLGREPHRRAAPRAVGGVSASTTSCRSKARSRSSTRSRPSARYRQARRAHHLRGRPVGPLARGCDVAGRGRARPPAVRLAPSSTTSCCTRRSSASCGAGSRAIRRCTSGRSGHHDGRGVCRMVLMRGCDGRRDARRKPRYGC